MQFMDSHIHLQDFKTKNATDIIKNALIIGVNKLVCVSALESDWPKVALLSEQFPNIVIPAFGIHPWYADKVQPEWNLRMAAYLQKYPHALVGEVGLDRFHDKNFEPQNSIFKTQIDLAKQYNRPLIIHAVRSHGWLDKYWSVLPQKFVVHSFNGRRELLNKIIAAGGYVSLSSSILKNPHKEDIVQLIPPERLLLETDSPSQSIYQTKEGNPVELPVLAAEIAALQNKDVETVVMQIYQNSLEFINVKK